MDGLQPAAGAADNLDGRLTRQTKGGATAGLRTGREEGTAREIQGASEYILNETHSDTLKLWKIVSS